MGRTFPSELLARTAVVGALAFLAIWTLWSFLPALGWAAVLAIATWPARQWLTRDGRSPTRAAILLTAIAGLLIVGPLLIVVIEATREFFSFCIGCESSGRPEYPHRNGSRSSRSWAAILRHGGKRIWLIPRQHASS